METFSRRDMLIKGGFMFISAVGCFSKIGSGFSDFTNNKTNSTFLSAMFNSKNYAIVKSVIGKVHVNEVPLKAGNKVFGDVMIFIEKESKVILSLPDRSMLSISGKTKIKLNSVIAKEQLCCRSFSSLPQIESYHQPERLNIHGQKAKMNFKGDDLSLSINFMV